MYSINLKKVSESTQVSAIVRLTATQLLSNPYMTVGDFFKSLSPKDVQHLQEMFVEMQAEDEASFSIIALINILCSAEGVEHENPDDQTQHLNYFCVLVGAMMLYHRGLVEVIFENLTFGVDGEDKEIVRMKYAPEA